MTLVAEQTVEMFAKTYTNGGCKMKFKLYFFKGGQPVPRWLIGFEDSKLRDQQFKNRSGKILFGKPCTVLRPLYKTQLNSLIVGNEYDNPYILIKGIDECTIGSVMSATGFFLYRNGYRGLTPMQAYIKYLEYNGYMDHDLKTSIKLDCPNGN